MKRRYIQSLVINNMDLAEDIMSGLYKMSSNYQFEIYETRNDHGIVTQIKIEIFMILEEE